MQNKSIFISKNPSETALLQNFCNENNFDLICKSFISFSTIKTGLKVETEAVFIGSKNAFDYYLFNQRHDSKVQIACIGDSTASYIESKGYKVSFAGKSAGNPEKVSMELNEWLNNRSICFIKSTESKGTIEKFVHSKKIQKLVLYETKFESFTFENEFDIIVFTSPSNVNSYMLSNIISTKTKIIAWGKTTKKELKKYDLTAQIVLKESSINELLETLKQL